MAFDPPDFKAGTVLSAAALAALADELERLGKISIVAPIMLGDDGDGLRFAVALAEVWQVKLTSGGAGGAYAWTRQIGDTAGTWADHPSGRTGTTVDDPAYELNGNATVALTPNPVVRAWRDPISRALVFESGSC